MSHALTAERVCQELRQWSLTSGTFPHLQQDPDSRAKGTPVPNHKTRHQSWLLSSPIPSTRKSTDTFQWLLTVVLLSMYLEKSLRDPWPARAGDMDTKVHNTKWRSLCIFMVLAKVVKFAIGAPTCLLPCEPARHLQQFLHRVPPVALTLMVTGADFCESRRRFAVEEAQICLVCLDYEPLKTKGV